MLQSRSGDFPDAAMTFHAARSKTCTGRKLELNPIAECFNLRVAEWLRFRHEAPEQVVQHVRAVLHTRSEFAAEIAVFGFDMRVETSVVRAFGIEYKVITTVETCAV